MKKTTGNVDLTSVFHQCVNHAHEVKQLTDKPKEKKPPNAFVLWSKQARMMRKNELQNLSPSEKMKKLGEWWKMADAAEREPFFKEADKLLIEYRNPNRKPCFKRPLTSYLFWAQDARKKIKEENPHITFTELSKKLAEQWRMLDRAKKNHAVKKAERIRLQHYMKYPDFSHEWWQALKERNTKRWRETTKQTQKDPTRKVLDPVGCTPTSSFELEKAKVDSVLATSSNSTSHPATYSTQFEPPAFDLTEFATKFDPTEFDAVFNRIESEEMPVLDSLYDLLFNDESNPALIENTKIQSN